MKRSLIIGGVLLIIIIIIYILFNKNNSVKDKDVISMNMDTIILNVNDHELTVQLENNSSVSALLEKLKEGNITINASDYGNFEKVGDLGFTLPTNDMNITTQPGDLILYQGDKLTLYYDTNTWSFTKLGRINISKEELINILGDGDVIITLSLNNVVNDISFDFNTKKVKLNSGYDMPINGIGTYSLTGDVCYNSILNALNSGVRLIDTAYMYHNEEEIGKAIKDSNVPREDIFIITKIYPSQFNDPKSAIDLAFEKLDLDYIDMMLLHHPGTNDVDAYKEMEKYVASGKIRSIGLSNWYIDELKSFMPQINIKPALVQNEIHPYYQENDVIPYIQSLGIVVQGWYPLGGRGHTTELLNDPVIKNIATNHNVSSAQVILRWNLQKGVVVIPGSSNIDHIKENTQLYHFELSTQEMNEINKLDRNEKHDWY